MPAVVRIFSGLHLGAEIELPDGLYVIGTDDSCDLILSESSLAPRHAALRVTTNGDAVELSAEALDGPVLLGGSPAGEECFIPAATPFQLGLLYAAWLPADAPEQSDVWAEIARRLLPQSTASLTDDASSPSPGAGQEQNDAPAEAEPEQSGGAASPQEAEPEVPAKAPKRGRDFALIAALVLAGFLCFSWESEPEPSPVQMMRGLLDEAGYEALTVHGDKESVVVQGRIATDRERGRLLRLAQLLQFPVYLDVTVRSDTADAVRASFNTLGLWPEVTELPPSARPGVRVRGYIKNGVLEQQALSNAVRNIPALQSSENGRPQLEIFREIRYESDVQAVLSPALSLAGLAEVERTFHPGRIELRGSLTPQSKAALEDIIKSVEAQLGVPVPFDVVNEAEVQTLKTNIYADQRSPDSRKQAESKEMKAADAFKVVSVSMGAMKFVTLDSGERVFEGGELPGGFLLEHIEVEALTLKKNGAVTVYPLRGRHE